MTLIGNKGEWSEIYAFFKILADGELYPGDASLNKIQGFFYPVISVLREELSLKKKISIINTNIVITDGVNQPITIPVSQFAAQAIILLNAIKRSSGPSFPVSSAESFLTQLGCYTLKANSTTKADIIINIHDSRTNLQPVLGFSIKSQLGSASTLLNASAATNFIFKLVGPLLSPSLLNQINGINTSRKIRDRIQAIYNNGNNLRLAKFDNQTFKNNLVLIDSLLPEILANALIGFFKDEIVSLASISNHLTVANPLNYDQSLNHQFYEHKLKRFLSEVALGMMPSIIWGGIYQGTEGYLVVKQNGDVVAYHIINRNLFEDYLLQNTKMENTKFNKAWFR